MERSAPERRNAIAAEVPRLTRYACALIRDRREADDLVHDCVVRALANLSSWRDGDSPRKWLFTIMHNIHIDQMRARKRSPVHVELEEQHQSASVVHPSDDVTRSEINAAMAALPLEQRQCVLLVGLEGLTYAEAADVLGVPAGTIMSRLSRGRERLRDLLDRDTARPTLRRVK